MHAGNIYFELQIFFIACFLTIYDESCFTDTKISSLMELLYKSNTNMFSAEYKIMN